MKNITAVFALCLFPLVTLAQFYGPDSQGRIYYNNGNVGIGISTASTKLQVSGGSFQQINSDLHSGIYLDATATNEPKIGWRVSDNSERFRIHLQGINTDAERLAFFKTIGSTAEVFSVLANGNIGIGITSPQAKLDVLGSIRIPLATNSDNQSPGLVAVLNDDFQYDGEFLNHYGLGFHTYNDGNYNGINAYLSSWLGMDFFTRGTSRLRINYDGNVGIGTTEPDAPLTVKGLIHTNEVRVDMDGAVAGDYVFEKDYDLLSLTELETYINQNKHLPEVPSAKEMEENGLNLKEMNLLLLKKVEELTLHLIEKEKKMIAMEKRIVLLETR